MSRIEMATTHFVLGSTQAYLVVAAAEGRPPLTVAAQASCVLACLVACVVAWRRP